MTGPLLVLAIWLAPVQHPPATGMNARGTIAMGFDQDRATHHFTITPDGGEIQITAKRVSDAETVAGIRAHLREAQRLFASGDFTKPEYIHGEMPPGAQTMAALKTKVRYRYRRLAEGGVLVISSPDPKAVAAAHEYLRYQIKEHKTGDRMR